VSEPIAFLATALDGRYRIERELGTGGMATVYLAHDVRHNRKVAVKVLRDDLTASGDGVRFVREIMLSSRLARDGAGVYCKSHDVMGRASLWLQLLAGGPPTILVGFDDFARPSYG
jgi:serine/threonine protein kinase